MLASLTHSNSLKASVIIQRDRDNDRARFLSGSGTGWDNLWSTTPKKTINIGNWYHVVVNWDVSANLKTIGKPGNKYLIA